MNYNIILACSTGVSSEIISNKMEIAANKSEENVTIKVMGADVKDTKGLDKKNIILLSPQLGHTAKELKEANPEALISVISERDFSVMDGEAMFDKAIAELKEANGEVIHKTINITIGCTDGFSASAIAKKMTEEAAIISDKIAINAVIVSDKNVEMLEDVDVLLLAPSVAFKEREIQRKLGNKTKVAVINMKDYGNADGKAIVEAGLKLMK